MTPDEVTRAILDMDRGDQARLRKLDRGHIQCSAFWKLAVQHRLDLTSDPNLMSRFVAGVRAVAYLTKYNNPNVPLGAALNNAGFSEARLNKMLGATGDTLLSEIVSSAIFLASKGQGVDASFYLKLAQASDEDLEESLKSKVAFSYYNSQHRP